MRNCIRIPDTERQTGRRRLLNNYQRAVGNRFLQLTEKMSIVFKQKRHEIEKLTKTNKSNHMLNSAKNDRTISKTTTKSDLP